MCSRPEVDSPRKRKPSAPQRPVGDKRARSIRDPDPPLTVRVESDEAERMYPGLTAEAQGHCVGVSGMMDVSTAQQVRLLARHVTQAVFTSSNDQGSNGQGSNDQGNNGQASTSHHAHSVVTDDDTGVTGHDEDDDMGVTEHDEDDTGVTRHADTGVTGHEDNDTGVTGHDEDDDTGVTRHDDPGITGHDEDDDTGVTGHDKDDDMGVTGHDEDDNTGVSGHVEDDDTGVTGHDKDDDMGVTGHDEDDDTGVTGHDEDDDTGVTGHDKDDDMGVTGHDEDDNTGVTREQAAESNEQLRRFHRFRGTVHTLLRFLVIQQTPHLPADVGPLEEIEDYVQRVLTSHCLSFE